MLQIPSELTPDAVEQALRRAAHRHDVSVHNVAHVGRHLHDSKPEEDALSFSICAPELYTALLAADIRISAFLPCRIAAFTQKDRTVLASVSPLEFCRLLNRPDLAALAVPLEDLLRTLMEETAEPAPAASQVTAAGEHRGGLGATEEQMSTRGALPQRIDKHGTKVEELAGTGEHDAQGG